MRRIASFTIVTVFVLAALGASGNAQADESTSTTIAEPIATSTTVAKPIATSTTVATSQIPLNSGSGRRIVYSNKSGQVWAINSDEQVFRTFLVSGRSGVPKPGRYKVFSQSPQSYSLDMDNVTFRFMTRFAIGPDGGNIGFHEIPLRYGRPMQTISQLGKFLSEGCLRAATADAQFIYYWAKVGTPIIVLP